MSSYQGFCGDGSERGREKQMKPEEGFTRTKRSGSSCTWPRWSIYSFWVLIFCVHARGQQRGNMGRRPPAFPSGCRQVWPRNRGWKEVGKSWLQHEQESSSLGPRLLAHSKAPLFPAQEFAACTTGRISQRKFAASVGGEECFKGLNGAFCWLVTLNGRRVLQATTCIMGSLCLLAQEDQPPQS